MLKKNCLLLALMLCCTVPALAADQWWESNNTRTIKALLESGEMEVWRGQMPMQNLEDIRAYLNTFAYWSELVKIADDRTKNIDAPERNFTKQVQSIQVEALPRLRQAYATVVGKSMEKEFPDLTAEVYSTDFKSLRFIWGGPVIPHDLAKQIHREQEWYFYYLCFNLVRLYHNSGTGNIKVQTFLETPPKDGPNDYGRKDSNILYYPQM